MATQDEQKKAEAAAAAAKKQQAAEQKAADEAKADQTEAQDEKSLQRYVVTVDALVVTTGKNADGSPVTTRLLHGAFVEGDPEDERIKTFLASKSITKERKDGSNPRATASMVTRALGGDDAKAAPRPEAGLLPPQ
jgi:hypothetical protein